MSQPGDANELFEVTSNELRTVTGQHLELVDGGYFDNTGTVTLAAIVDDLAIARETMISEGSWPKGGIRLIVIAPHFRHIQQNKSESPHYGSYELFTVASALLASRDTLSSSYADIISALQRFGHEIRERVVNGVANNAVFVRLDLDDLKHIEPFGWFISAEARKAIREQLGNTFFFPDVDWPAVSLSPAEDLEEALNNPLHYYPGEDCPRELFPIPRKRRE